MHVIAQRKFLALNLLAQRHRGMHVAHVLHRRDEVLT